MHLTKKQIRTAKIKEILNKIIHSKNPTDWSIIVNAVKAEMKIKNWLEVRSILQVLLNDGIIKRIKNAHVEEYLKI